MASTSKATPGTADSPGIESARASPDRTGIEQVEGTASAPMERKQTWADEDRVSPGPLPFIEEVMTRGNVAPFPHLPVEATPFEIKIIEDLDQGALQDLEAMLGADSFESTPQETPPRRLLVQHRIDSLHRKIEAMYGTDLVVVKGRLDRVETPSSLNKHTRIFEAVGDYIPNLVEERDGRLRCVEPTFVHVTLPAGVDIVDPRSLRKGRNRYHLVNGKCIDLAHDAPFVRITAVPSLSDLPCYAYRENITEAEMSAAPERPLKNQRELFEAAICRAGGVQEARLMPYYIPDIDSLGETYGAEYLTSVWRGSPRLKGLETSTYLEALSLLGKDIEDKMLVSKGSPLYEAWTAWSQYLDNGLSEDQAKAIYMRLKEILPTDEGLNEAAKLTSRHVHPVDNKGKEIVEFYVDGSYNASVVDWEQTYRTHANYTLAPYGASQRLTQALLVLPHIHTEVVTANASFSLDTSILTPSVAPRLRHFDRGVGEGTVLWHERLDVCLEYSGLLLIPRPNSTSETREWCIALNTLLVEEYVRRGIHAGHCNLVCAIPGIRRPSRLPGPYIGGVGIKDGQLFVSPYETVEWNKNPLPDCRIRFPARAVAALINNPERYSLRDVDRYLEGRGPLVIIARIGEDSREFYYHPRLVFDPDARDVNRLCALSESGQPERSPNAVVDDRSGVGTPPPASTSLTYGSDPASWQANVAAGKVPFSQIIAFADRGTGVTQGNWPQLRRHVLSLNPPWTEEKFKNYYSVHWQAANGGPVHEVVHYHNPAWTQRLEDAPKNADWWEWPRKKLNVQPLLSADDLGRLALYASEAREFLAAKNRKAQQANYSRGRALPHGRAHPGTVAAASATVASVPPLAAPVTARLEDMEWA